MKKLFSLLTVILAISILLCGCKDKSDKKTEKPSKNPQESSQASSSSPADENSPGAVNPMLFCDEFEGTWTADNNEFIDLYIENEKAFILFADWGSEDYSKIAEITAVNSEESNSYSIVLSFPEYTDANGNITAEGQVKKCTVTDLKNGYIRLETSDKTTDYFYDGRQQYPI